MPEATKDSYGYPSAILNGIAELPPFRPAGSAPGVVPTAPWLDSGPTDDSPPPPYPGITSPTNSAPNNPIFVTTTQPTYQSTITPGRE
uniref:Mammalian cell entry protein n=1 Tax=Caenorhabditis tropicalis TaxID=1561998 RepID=A0A1I7UWS4_9PELO